MIDKIDLEELRDIVEVVVEQCGEPATVRLAERLEGVLLDIAEYKRALRRRVGSEVTQLDELPEPNLNL